MSTEDSSTQSVPEPTERRRGLQGWRLWLGGLLLLLTAAATIALGNWQLRRAAEKSVIAERVAAAQEQAPLALSAAVTEAELIEWRQAWARGAWLTGFSVLLENRNHDGRPGYWVATPLCFASPDAPATPAGVAVDCDRAILVLRGWLPRSRPGEPPPAVPPASHRDAYGVLLHHVPRLFELSSLGAAQPAAPDIIWNNTVPVLQNLDLDEYRATTGLPLLPVVLQQIGDAGDGLLRAWAGPPVDVDKHKGYALQWFSFAAIALIALGVILVQALRSKSR